MDFLQIGNHTLSIQHWTGQGGGVEDVAFFCFVAKDNKVCECNATKEFEVWACGSVNAAEVEARKAATKHARQLIADYKARKAAAEERSRLRNEAYFGKPSGKP